MRRLATAATALLLLLGAAPAAHAAGRDLPQRSTVKDRTGEVAASIDLVSGRFTHSRKRTTWSVRVTELTDTTFIAFQQLWESDSWDRIAVYREGGRTVAKLYDVDASEAVTTATERPCPGLRVQWDTARDRVGVRMPDGCGIGARTADRGRDEIPTWLEAISRVGGDPGSARDAIRSVALGDPY